MKQILLVLAMLATCLWCNAQHTLNVVLKSGDYISYDFVEKPKVMVGKSTINLTTARVQIEFNMNEVQRFSIDDAPATLTKAESVSVVSQQQGPIEIYTIDSVLLRRTTLNESEISYTNLPKGIYIIKKGKTSHKLIIR